MTITTFLIETLEERRTFKPGGDAPSAAASRSACI